MMLEKLLTETSILGWPKRPELPLFDPGLDDAFSVHKRDAMYLREWWVREIEPLFKNAIKVTGYIRDGTCSFGAPPSNRVHPSLDTFQALLINIKPIKEETAEELLQKMVDRFENSDGLVSMHDIVRAAKEFLERKK